MRQQLLPGPLMVDIEGLSVTDRDREIIAHPLVGGIILFSRNYHDRDQLRALINDMRGCRQGDLLIAVDHEGGRVQRFKHDFTAIPPMRVYGERYNHDRKSALSAMFDTAALLACELRECGVDFSFAPVVDIDHGKSDVIGDRSFHHSAEAVVDLAGAVIDGFASVGCANVIKHFPGHGSVAEDTHEQFAHDRRTLQDIAGSDQLPFAKLANRASAVMPAHVVYDDVDHLPASLSRIWLTEILRGQLGFDGAIISDDLSMAAVARLAPASETAQQALQAGSDMVLICNDRDAVERSLDALDITSAVSTHGSVSAKRLLKLKAKADFNGLNDSRIAATRELISSLA